MTGTDQPTGIVTLDEALAELGAGGTVADVAHVLRRAGIKGRRGDAYDCPIARYLRLRTGMTDIGVAPRGVYPVIGDCDCEDRCTRKKYGGVLPYNMPRVVTDFIMIVDQAGHQAGYPDLMED